MDEQTMIYIGIIAGVLLILLVQYFISRKAHYRNICQKVKEQWGKVSDREYTLEEFDKISHYYEQHKGERFSIDDITWNDMGMDDIFLLLNTTGSAIGEEYLYWALRTPEFDEKVLKRRSELADYFRANTTAREQYAVCFAQMGRKKRIALADYVHKLKEMPKTAAWPHVLAILLLIGAIGSFGIRPAYGIGILLCVIIFNVITYYKYKGDMDVYFQCMSEVADLVEYGLRLNRIDIKAEILEPYQKNLRETCSGLKPVRSQSWILSTKSGVGGSLMEAAIDYMCMMTHLDLLMFHKITKVIKNKGAELELLMETMGCLELGLCIGSYREFLGSFCEPVFHRKSSGTLCCQEIYHPLVENAVPNTIRTDKPVLVTGSNASGKSTFLKTIGINAILAQTIYTVSAKYYETDFCKVYSSMALSDSLETKESYYMVEIKSLKRILDTIGDEIPVLCFVDEVLRGTNTVERISASAKILESMAGKNVLCFAATHDIELTKLLCDLYANYHFEEQIEDNDVLFSYKLYPGRAETRNAIRLLSIMGYDGRIIENAQAMAERFVKTGEWSLE
ncbi:hypothetical protein LQE92_00075 [Lacrimispora sp. NSJ-141]|uniref:DNA mismatch repair proteins mutS family domain-containing protein n=1 Tax=Lientehia hominis TaxID=2897778 RepID=A0AAP2RHK4_9FIRM|nr:hypothetical protein [Lientehia hominis]MCD2491018.1 hypothetical protein [Lientehia hominis]